MPSIVSRDDALIQLVTASRPMSELKDCISKLPWDSHLPLVVLRAEDCRRVLQRYIDGTLSGAELETWGDLVEAREDIEKEKAYESVIGEFIFSIANPLLAQEQLSPGIAAVWISRLS